MNLLNFSLPDPPKGTYWWLEIPGEAPQKKRARFGRDIRMGPFIMKKGHGYNASKKDEVSIAWEVKAAFPKFGVREPDPKQLWGLRCIFWRRDWRRNRDNDNAVKLIRDALQGLIWKNDAQVREDYQITLPTDRPRIEILFYHLPQTISSQGR